MSTESDDGWQLVNAKKKVAPAAPSGQSSGHGIDANKGSNANASNNNNNNKKQQGGPSRTGTANNRDIARMSSPGAASVKSTSSKAGGGGGNQNNKQGNGKSGGKSAYKFNNGGTAAPNQWRDADKGMFHTLSHRNTLLS